MMTRRKLSYSRAAGTVLAFFLLGTVAFAQLVPATYDEGAHVQGCVLPQGDFDGADLSAPEPVFLRNRLGQGSAACDAVVDLDISNTTVPIVSLGVTAQNGGMGRGDAETVYQMRVNGPPAMVDINVAAEVTIAGTRVATGLADGWARGSIEGLPDGQTVAVCGFWGNPTQSCATQGDGNANATPVQTVLANNDYTITLSTFATSTTGAGRLDIQVNMDAVFGFANAVDAANYTFEFSPDMVPATPALRHRVGAAGNFNGNNKTDLAVMLRDPVTDRNTVHIVDGGSGNLLNSVPFGKEPAMAFLALPDATTDTVPEFGVLVEGSLFARVKDPVNGMQLGKPTFNASNLPVAFLSVGDAGGGAGPDVAALGRNPFSEKVQAQVKDASSGALVKNILFSKNYVPFDAVALDNVGDSAAMEIAVLGIHANGKVRAQVKDAATGNQISVFTFNKAYTPLAFAAVPNPAGKMKYLAVLGRNASGAIQAQIRRASNGLLVGNVKFSKAYDPVSLFSFADSNGSGGGEIGVVGVHANGAVRAQVLEIADGANVAKISFSASYPPLDAIAVNGVAGTGRNEIAVLGRNASGDHRLQIKDLLTKQAVNVIPLP